MGLPAPAGFAPLNAVVFGRPGCPLRLLLVPIALFVYVPVALAGPSIPVRQVVPPDAPLAGVRSVRVGSMTGFKGHQLGDDFAAAMKNPNRGDVATTGPSVGQAMLSGMSFGFAGQTANGDAGNATSHQVVLNDGITMDVVKLVTSGGDAVFSGSAEYTSNDVNYTDTKSVTENGVTYDKTVLCVRRDVTVNYTWALTSAKGAVLLSDQQSLPTADSACDSAVPSLPMGDSLAAGAIDGVAVALANRLAPHIHEYRIDLAGGKAVKDAIKLQEDGDLVGAACMLNTAFATKADATVAYDLAGMLEGLGDLDGAIAWDTKSAGIKGSKYIDTALKRLNARKVQLAAFEKAYGAKYTIGAFDFATCK